MQRLRQRDRVLDALERDLRGPHAQRDRFGPHRFEDRERAEVVRRLARDLVALEPVEEGRAADHRRAVYDHDALQPRNGKVAVRRRASAHLENARGGAYEPRNPERGQSFGIGTSR